MNADAQVVISENCSFLPAAYNHARQRSKAPFIPIPMLALNSSKSLLHVEAITHLLAILSFRFDREIPKFGFVGGAGGGCSV